MGCICLFNWEPSTRTLLLAALVSCLLISLPFASDAQDRVGTLSGRVIREDGVRLSGATIQVLDSSTRTVVSLALTDEEGAYRIQDLPEGSYIVRASYTGSREQEQFVSIQFAQESSASFILLSNPPSLDDLVINGAGSAASNLPAYVPGSAVAAGSTLVGYAANSGPSGGSIADRLPLALDLSGFSASIEMGGQAFPVFPVYSFPGQFAGVVSADTPLGEGNLRIRFNDAESAPFRIRIVESQPGFFTVSEDGQGRMIATMPDGSLITPRNPATIGGALIGWGTDGSSFHDRPGVENLLSELEIRYYLGGREIPEGQMLYYGPSGGFAGGLQAASYVPFGWPTGCGVPFFALVKTGTDEVSMSNVVTVPVSEDGSPCEDPHGMTADAVSQVFSGSFRNIDITFDDESSFDGERRSNVTTTFVEGLEFNRFSFEAPGPFGSCTSGWRPQVYQAAAPRRLELLGSLTPNIPGIPEIRIDENTGIPAYRLVLSTETQNAIAAGTFTYSFGPGFAVDGHAFPAAGEGELTGVASPLSQSIKDLVQDGYTADGFVSLEAALDAYDSALGDVEFGRSYLHYNLTVDNGVLGTHSMDCYATGNRDDLAAERDSLLDQASMIIKKHFPSETQNAYVQVIINDSDPHRMVYEDGPVDQVVANFLATTTYRIRPLDWEETWNLIIFP